MPYQLTYHEDEHLAIVHTSGVSALDDLRAIIREVRTLLARGEKLRVLIDRRRSEWVISEAEARQTVAGMAAALAGFAGRLAVLTTEAKLPNAQAFAELSRAAGFQVEAFTDQERALKWLAARGR